MLCKNCNTTLTNNQKYCFECGAKIIKNRLTLKNIFQDINNHFFNLDNAFLKTFLNLFTKPEVVINSYIEGTRKKHLGVIQYFAIGLTLVGFQIFLTNLFFKDELNIDMLFGDTFNKLPNQKDNPFSPKNFDFDQFNNYQSLFYILSVPFSAIATWLAYRIIGDKRFNFTEHIVINLYYSAQIIIVSVLFTVLLLCLGVSYITISSLVFILTFIYFFYVLKRVFSTSFLNTLACFILVMLVIVLLYVFIIILGIIFGVVFVLINKL